jgi:hypothetical protein
LLPCAKKEEEDIQTFAATIIIIIIIIRIIAIMIVVVVVAIRMHRVLPGWSYTHTHTRYTDRSVRARRVIVVRAMMTFVVVVSRGYNPFSVNC